MAMENWYIRNTEGKVFGPIDLETLKAWVKEGRVEPLAGVSSDLQNWVLAPLKPELEMNWVVENNPGQFYGPTHRTVVEDLVKTGSLSRDARFYEDDRGAAEERIHAMETAMAAKDAEVSRRDVALARRSGRDPNSNFRSRLRRRRWRSAMIAFPSLWLRSRSGMDRSTR